MAGYLQKTIAERAQRLARMRAARPGARGADAAATVPGCRCGGAAEERASLLARIEVIERALAAALCQPEVRPKAQMQIAAIKTAVCRYYGLTAADLAQRRRSRAVSRVRQVAIFLARRLTGKSFRALAQAFGDRNHSSPIRAFRTIERLREANAETDADLQAIAGELGARCLARAASFKTRP